MDSPLLALASNETYLYFLVALFILGIAAAVLLYFQFRKGERLVMAKCGHFTKIKGTIFIEGVKVPIDLSLYGDTFLPIKCIKCVAIDTLGDVAR